MYRSPPVMDVMRSRTSMSLVEDRSLDVGEGKIGDAGGESLAAGNTRRMTARGAAASEHDEQRQRIAASFSKP